MSSLWVHRLSDACDRLLPADSLRKRLAVGVSWVMAGSIIRQLASFVAVLGVARALGVADFGKLAVIQSTVLMISSFGQAGIGLSTTKYVASTRALDPERAGRIIGFSLAFVYLSSFIVVLLLLIFSPLLETRLLPGTSLSRELRFSSGWICFEILSLIQMRILAGLEAFRSSANITFCQGVLLLPVVLPGAYLGGVTGTVLSYSAVSLASCVIGHILLRKECRRCNIRIQYRHSWGERGILKMSTMVWVSATVMNTSNWLVGIILARQPGGLVEYAVFNAASRFQNVLSFLPTRIFHVSLPVLANLQAAGNRPGFTRALAGMGGVAMSFTITGAALLLIFSDTLMSWYGKGFARGGDVLATVAFLCVVSSLWTVASAGLWAAEQSRQMLSLDVLRGGLLLLLCLAGVAATAKGLALAHLVSYAVCGALLLAALFRYLKYQWVVQGVPLKNDLPRVS